MSKTENAVGQLFREKFRESSFPFHGLKLATILFTQTRTAHAPSPRRPSTILDKQSAINPSLCTIAETHEHI